MLPPSRFNADGLDFFFVCSFVTRAAIGYVWIASVTTVAPTIINRSISIPIILVTAAMVAETCIICARFINGDSPGKRGVIRGYINCIPYGASVTVHFELQLSNLVADKLDVEASGKPGFKVDGATSCTVAVLPGHRIRDIFVRACSTALTHRRVRVVLVHIHVEVATSEV